ncbi:MAG: glycosyltransferase family 39 protein [Chloroflexi bacterium]|nr:glycosyltransferase family 39 protein [Chloroflexota bacterium]
MESRRIERKTVARRAQRRVPLLAWAILAAYLLLGGLYSVVNPLFESPDELTHYPYIAQLASGGGLPVQRPEQTELWAQEGSQPPLYYALGAVLTGWIDTGDLTEVRVENPHARVGEPGVGDNLNAALHGPREGFPWRGTALAVHLVRYFSLVLGAGTVWCTYALARTVLPGRPAVALGAMALNAFLPMFLFISASVNNDNLVTFLASFSLLLCVRLGRDEASRAAPLALGVLIGLAGLAKLTGLGLLAPALAALLVREVSRVRRAVAQGADPRAARRAACGRMLGAGAIVGVAVLAVAGWWYLRNWRLYNDPLGTAAMVRIMGRRESLPSWREALGEFRGLRMSYWGILGWFNVLLRPRALYTLFDALSLLGLVGLGVGAWRAHRRGTAQRRTALALLVLWTLVVCAGLLRWTLTTPASQGRLLFPAIGAISVLLSLGLASLAPRYGRTSLAVVGAALLAVAAATPCVTLRAAYAPPVLAESALPAGVQSTAVTYGDTARLVGYRVEPAAAAPGEALVVELYWQALRQTETNLSLFVHLYGRGRQAVGQRDSFPGGGLCPTTLWTPGSIVRDRLSVPVSAAADGPTALSVVVGLYDRATGAVLPATDAEGRAVGEVRIAQARLAVGGRIHLPTYPLDALLGERVRLIGYDLKPGPYAPGATVPLVLYWEVTQALGGDYTVLVHLLDDSGAIVSQGDGPPLGGEYPTSLWAPGETLADARSLTLEGDLAAGRYRLVVGLYEPGSWVRLPVADAQGAVPGDAVALGLLEVEAQ